VAVLVCAELLIVIRIYFRILGDLPYQFNGISMLFLAERFSLGADVKSIAKYQLRMAVMLHLYSSLGESLLRLHGVHPYYF
jgi:hypothetical protein